MDGPKLVEGDGWMGGWMAGWIQTGSDGWPDESKLVQGNERMDPNWLKEMDGWIDGSKLVQGDGWID